MSEAALSYPPLPVGGVRRLGVGWWGVLCVLLTEGALFGYLLFSYGYYAVQLDPGWMPAGRPSLLLAAPNTLVLMLSSVAVWWGERAMRRGRRGTAADWPGARRVARHTVHRDPASGMARQAVLVALQPVRVAVLHDHRFSHGARGRRRDVARGGVRCGRRWAISTHGATRRC